MTFSEKLLQLRKEKGLSQEALAEKLNTTRQAISKWENAQGYPETEKLLMIGNIFNVSMDYLLKDTVQPSNDEEAGYYVSNEMAEGYLFQQHRIAKYSALGVSLIILSSLPYFIFKENPAIYAFFIIIIATPGIVAIILAQFIEDDDYKVLKRETLLFDQSYLKSLTAMYENTKKRYAAVMIFGICLIAIGGVVFLLEKKDIALGVLVPYYPICIGLIAIGVYITMRTSILLDAYKLLAKNMLYTDSFGFKFRRKVRKKVEDL